MSLHINRNILIMMILLGGVSLGDRASAEAIVWQHISGQVHYWTMEHGERGGRDIHIPVGPEWSLVGIGDLDGDGSDDIVWQHARGQTHFWRMKKGFRIEGIDIGDRVGRPWHVAGIGDLDGDGNDDILWQHISGQIRYWRVLDGAQVESIDIDHSLGREWALIGLGDLDGDNNDELVWRRVNGDMLRWKIQDVSKVEMSGIESFEPMGFEWKLVGIGDLDDDGTDDLLWQRCDGQLYYWRMQGGQQIEGHDIRFPVSPDWSLEGIGRIP